MAVKIGNSTLLKRYLGTSEVTKIYLGDNLIYQSGLNIETIISDFKIRVSTDGGTFEAEQCLRDLLTILNAN